jgi:hypothetical protein
MIVVDISDLRYIALAGVQLRSNRHVAELCETAADVLDVFVHAEDLLNDQHDRKRPAFVGHCSIGGNIAVGDGDLYFAGDQSVRVGRDCLGGYWLDGQREPGCESGDYKFSPGQRDLWLESGQVFKHMLLLVVFGKTRLAEAHTHFQSARQSQNKGRPMNRPP